MAESSETPNADELISTLFGTPQEASVEPDQNLKAPIRKNSFERMAYVVGGILTLCIMTCIVSAAVWATTWFVYLLWGSR